MEYGIGFLPVLPLWEPRLVFCRKRRYVSRSDSKDPNRTIGITAAFDSTCRLEYLEFVHPGGVCFWAHHPYVTQDVLFLVDSQRGRAAVHCKISRLGTQSQVHVLSADKKKLVPRILGVMLMELCPGGRARSSARAQAYARLKRDLNQHSDRRRTSR